VQAAGQSPPILKAEPRGWNKGRNACWKSDNKRGRIEKEYGLRIAELQANWLPLMGR